MNDTQSLASGSTAAHEIRRDPPWAFAVRLLLFPFAILAPLVAASSGYVTGMALQFGTFFIAILLIACAEMLLPESTEIKPSSVGDWKVDATSFAFMMAIVNPMFEFGLPFLAAGLLAWVDLPVQLGWFPSSWPLLPKVALAALIAEFGQYWMHRIAHEHPLLWRFHASHHSSERLYWLNGFRVHPFNAVWHHLAGVFILKIIGADPLTLSSYLAVAAVATVFQHGNVRLILGPFNWIFSTNELHRWHHADRPELANRNYGGVLSVWDIVFGTYLCRPGEKPESYGLFAGNDSYPRQSWWGQMIVPFIWKRHRTAWRKAASSKTGA